MTRLIERQWPYALVAFSFVIAVLVQVPVRYALSWDEVVYASQIAKHSPMAWAAPRGRGMPLLSAPVTLVTSDATAIRIYFLVIAGAALFCTLVIWSEILGCRVTVISGAIFASLWITETQAPMDLGNLWLAFAVAISSGLFLRYMSKPRFVSGIGLSISCFAATVFHGPTDGVFLLIALTICLFLADRSVRRALMTAMLAGVSAGVLEWAIEAQLYFGGPLNRLREAQQDGSGFGVFLTGDVRSLVPNVLGTAWWVVIVALTIAGVIISIRSRAVSVIVPAIVGLVMLLEYAVFIPQGQARYLLPTLFLWSIPAAYVFKPLQLRFAVVSSVVLVALSIGAQHSALMMTRHNEISGGNTITRTAADLRKVVHGRCAVLGSNGSNAIPVAYYAGCDGVYVSYDTNVDRFPVTKTLVVLARGVRSTPYKAQNWQLFLLPGSPLQARIRPPQPRT
jgi:hypothetical protein